MVLSSTLMTIAWIAASFDVVYLKAGQSFTDAQWDVKLFKSLGITTIAHFAGSDSRPPYLNGFHGKVMSGPELVEWSERIKGAVDRAQMFDYVIDNPLAGHFHSRRCIIGQCLGTIADVDWVESCAMGAIEDRVKLHRVRVVHTPSRAAVKGSDIVRNAVETLQENGTDIDYIEVENQSNAVALSMMATADIVVDELYSDSIGATVSSEAAILGKPSINGTYGISELRRFLPHEAVLPTYLIEPEQFLDALKALVADKAAREQLGRSARSFVTARNTQKAVAERLLLIASGAAPQTWYFDPYEIGYVYGVAGSKDEVRRAIVSTLETGGIPALQLDDKPKLRDAIVEFSRLSANRGSTVTLT